MTAASIRRSQRRQTSVVWPKYFYTDICSIKPHGGTQIAILHGFMRDFVLEGYVRQWTELRGT